MRALHLFFLLLLSSTSLTAQISLKSFKSLSSDDPNFQEDFFSRNNYKFGSHELSPGNKLQRYLYFKTTTSSDGTPVYRDITVIRGMKFIIFSVNNLNYYLTQKEKLLSEPYTKISEDEVIKKFPCMEEKFGTSKFSNHEDGREAGIASIYLLKSGYLLGMFSAKENNNTVYAIVMFHPEFCKN